MRWLRTWLFGISLDETRFAKRGFRVGDGEAQARLEQVGAAFLFGYHHALDESEPLRLAARLDSIDAALAGFAFEGAAMALALLDFVVPGRGGRVRALLDGPGDRHAYMIHVGVGWALARLHRGAERALRPFDPLLRWLALDGYGFHEGYFHWRRYFVDGRTPRLRGYARRGFDQGLGRSAWFVYGADVGSLSAAISALAPERHGDLWSGVGLAVAYAGGAGEAELRALRGAVGPHLASLGQGVAFAAKARLRAGNLTPHTEEACRMLIDRPAADAAAVADAALANLPADGEVPAYEVWRRRIQGTLEGPGSRPSASPPAPGRLVERVRA